MPWPAFQNSGVVDIDGRAGAAGVGAVEECDHPGGVGQHPQGPGPQDIEALGVGGVLGVAVHGGEPAGEVLDGPEQPDRVEGVEAGHEAADAVFVLAADLQHPSAAAFFGLGVGQGLVGLDHPRGDQGQQPAGGQAGEDLGDRGVDEPGGLVVEVLGLGGDLAGHPGLQLQGLDRCPHRRHPVEQRHGIGHELAGGLGVDLQGNRELGRGVFIDQHARGQRTDVGLLVPGLPPMRDRPLQRHLELLGLGPP